MKFEYLFWVFFVGVIAHLAWRYFRSGRSLTGAMLGGRISREIGEISLSQGSFTSQVLRVLDMESPEGERFIGLSVVSKAPLAASMVSYRLSRAQAQQLVSLLQRATGSQGAA
ncbi:hypothetical protein [Dokdonella sp.]|uniref:hypothetical protein n=1 Tax=Dokdonella sp. TaxID=2291710 RepID=UPI0025C368AB|nr:hypothetical protein [Dokdonella sp.]MBX3691578.1 hypothetical protein [Dokdonella sp.]